MEKLLVVLMLLLIPCVAFAVEIEESSLFAVEFIADPCSKTFENADLKDMTVNELVKLRSYYSELYNKFPDQKASEACLVQEGRVLRVIRSKKGGKK